MGVERWIPSLVSAWRSRLGPSVRRRGGPLSPFELEDTARALLQLQRGLTGDRRLIGARYMEDPRLLGAYLLYYWPVGYTQARFVLQRLERPFQRVLDLGCGPGPLLAAALDHSLEQGVQPHLTGGERSREAALLASELLGSLDQDVRLFPWDGEKDDPVPGDRQAGERPDLITLGFVLNELWAGQPDRVRLRTRLLRRLVASLAPGGLVLVTDPASLGPSRDLLAVRDALLQQGLEVRAPCLWQGPCPALARAGGTCHSEVEWSLPDPTWDLARRAGLHKDRLKMAWMAVGPRTSGPPQAPGPGPHTWRVVSEPMVNKAGRTRLLLCGASGRLTLSARAGEGHPAERTFLSLMRGDVIHLEGGVERAGGGGDGGAAQALGPGTRITRSGPS